MAETAKFNLFDLLEISKKKETRDFEKDNVKRWSSMKRYTWATRNPEHLSLNEMILIQKELNISVPKLIEDYSAGTKIYTSEELKYLGNNQS